MASIKRLKPSTSRNPIASQFASQSTPNVVESSLSLSHTDIRSLPEGLTVCGSVYILYCTSLISLPKGLTVHGSVNLTGCTSLISLPEGLTVGGDLDLTGCTGLISLPEGLTVRGSVNLSGCTSLIFVPDRAFHMNVLKHVPANLPNANQFKIVEHLDKYDTIDHINPHELQTLYCQTESEIHKSVHGYRCGRIARSYCYYTSLNNPQKAFKRTADKETKHTIMTMILAMFHPKLNKTLFKKLPGINTAKLFTNHSTNGAEIIVETFPFIMNFGFLTTQETQSIRQLCGSLKTNIRDQMNAYEDPTLLKQRPSPPYSIDQIL